MAAGGPGGASGPAWRRLPRGQRWAGAAWRCSGGATASRAWSTLGPNDGPSCRQPGKGNALARSGEGSEASRSQSPDRLGGSRGRKRRRGRAAPPPARRRSESGQDPVGSRLPVQQQQQHLPARGRTGWRRGRADSAEPGQAEGVQRGPGTNLGTRGSEGKAGERGRRLLALGGSACWSRCGGSTR